MPHSKICIIIIIIVVVVVVKTTNVENCDYYKLMKEMYLNYERLVERNDSYMTEFIPEVNGQITEVELKTEPRPKASVTTFHSRV